MFEKFRTSLEQILTWSNVSLYQNWTPSFRTLAKKSLSVRACTFQHYDQRSIPEVEKCLIIISTQSRETSTSLTQSNVVEGFWWRNRQSKRFSPRRSWVRFSRRTRDAYVRRVSQWMSWAFSGYSGFLQQGMLTGWVRITPSLFVNRSCAPWSDMSHRVAARGVLISLRESSRSSCVLRISA